MADEDLKIIIRASIDDSAQAIRELDREIGELSNKINSLKLNLDVDSKQLTQVTKQIDTIQKSLGKQESIRVFDKEQIQSNSVAYFRTMDEAIKKYRELGKVTSQANIDPITKQMQDFTLTVDKGAEGIEKLRFGIAKIADGENIENYFTLDKLSTVDKSIELREKALQEEQKVRKALEKEYEDFWNKSLAQQEKEENNREKILQEEQKILKKIEESKIKEQQLTEELEHQLKLYKQQAAITAQNASRRFEGLINTREIANYLDKVNKLEVNENIKRQMKDLSMEFKQIEVNAKTASGAIDIANKSSISLGDAIKTAAVKFPLWVGISTIFFGSARAMEDLARQIYVVDQQMTELNRVSENFNLEQTLQESVLIADDLGQKIAEVNEAMIQASRMGLEGQDLFGLTRAAVLMSSISDLTAEEALNNLSSTLVQFNMNTSDAIDIVSRLNSVDNDYVASTKDLSQSISKAGAVAETFGISLNTLLGYTVAVSEATRESGNVIGNSIKSWATRITTMNGAISALKEVGVDVFDPLTGEVNKVEDIIESLGSKWDSLGKSTQQNLALLIAGRHHVSRFAGLMGNYASVAGVVETALNSQGSAMAENLKYQQSLEAQLAKLSNSWTEFAVVLGEAGLKDFFSLVLTSATAAMNAFTGLTEATNGLNISLPILTIALAAATKGMLAFSGSAKAAKISLGWIGAILIGVELLATAFIGSAKANEQNTGAMIESAQTMSDTADQVERLVQRYEELRPQAEKSKEAQDELKVIMGQLQQIAPQLTGSLNDQRDALDLNAEAANKYAASLRSMSKELLSATGLKLDSDILTAEDDLESARSKLDDYQNEYEGHLEKLKELEIAYGVQGVIEVGNAIEQARKNGGIEGRMIAFDDMDFVEIRKSLEDSGYLDTLIEINEKEGELGSLRERKQAVIDLIEGNDRLDDSLSGVADGQEELSDAVSNSTEEFKSQVSEIKELNGVISDLNDGQTVTSEKIFDLLDKYPELINYIHKTADGWAIEEEAITNLRNERIQDQIDAIEAQSQISSNLTDEVENRLKGYDIEISKIQDVKSAREELANINKPLLASKSPIESDESFLRKQFDQLNGGSKLSSPLMQGVYDSALEEYVKQEQAAYEEYSKLYGETIDYGKSEEERRKNAKALEERLAALREELQNPTFNDRSSSSTKEEKPFDPYVPDEYANAIERIQLAITQSESRQQKFNQTAQQYTEELNLQIQRYREMQTLASQEADSLRARNTEIENQLKNTSLTVEEHSALTEELDKNNSAIRSLSSSWIGWENSIVSANNEIKDIAQTISDDLAKSVEDAKKELEDVADGIIDLYKDIHIKQRDAALEGLQDQLDAENARHQNVMDNLDEEMDKYRDSIQEKLDAIDKQVSEDEYLKNLEKLNDEETKLQNELNKLSLDNSIEAKKRKIEIEKELSQVTENIEELKSKRSIELQKNALQENLDMKEKDIEEEKKREEQRHIRNTNRIERDIEAERKKWERIIEDDETYTEIREQILSGHFDNIKEDFSEFKDFLLDNSDLLGEGLTNTLIRRLEDAESSMNDLNNTKLDGLNLQFETFIDFIESHAHILGETLTKELIEKLRLAQQEIDKLNAKEITFSLDGKYKEEDGELYVNQGGKWYKMMDWAAETIRDRYEEFQGGGSGSGGSSGGGSNNSGGGSNLPDLPSDYRTGGKNGLQRKVGSNWYDLTSSAVASMRKKYSFHDGGIVGGSTSRIGEMLNKVFNNKPNERTIQSLVGELQIPPKNFSNGLDNIRMAMNSIIPKTQAAGTSIVNNVNVNVPSGWSPKQSDSLAVRIVREMKNQGADF